ncbi:hypothetical protein ANTPLA_LOCUS10906 [Anthophora plagiata]
MSMVPHGWISLGNRTEHSGYRRAWHAFKMNVEKLQIERGINFREFFDSIKKLSSMNELFDLEEFIEDQETDEGQWRSLIIEKLYKQIFSFSLLRNCDSNVNSRLFSIFRSIFIDRRDNSGRRRRRRRRQ